MQLTIQTPAAAKLSGHPYLGREIVGLELACRLQESQSEEAEASLNANIGSSFFIADLGEDHRQFIRWKKNLPRVEPFYAVKCNPDLQVKRLLAKLGAIFDCASKAEIEQVLALKPTVSCSNIIFANLCKENSHIRYAVFSMGYGIPWIPEIPSHGYPIITLQRELGSDH
jgi:hypothetical protein